MLIDTHSRILTGVYAAFALLAFAANSIICRLALRDGGIDAGSFSVVRLLSGALSLWIILLLSGYRKSPEYSGSWISAAMLFVYAFAFSYAYVGLQAGTGALILFGAVQLTMLLTGVVQGEHLRRAQWIGLSAAVGGLIYLLTPGLTSPPFGNASIMALAGVAWGIYSLRGRGNAHPAAVTTDNFIRTVPLVVVAGVFLIPHYYVTLPGIGWAVLSGALTSGVGYILWYAAVSNMQATRAAIIQLAVPVIAAFGGVVLLSEIVSYRLVLASVLTLGGVLIAVLREEKR